MNIELAMNWFYNGELYINNSYISCGKNYFISCSQCPLEEINSPCQKYDFLEYLKKNYEELFI